MVGVGDFDLCTAGGVAGEEIDAAVFGLGVGHPGDGVRGFLRGEWSGVRDRGEVGLGFGSGRGGKRCRIRHLRAEEMWMKRRRGDDRQE
jgi:hypothetical protein